MTDEELAEKEYENCKFEKIEHYCDKAIYVTGFLAGLKVGRPQWHDLRKDPTDLPKNSSYFNGQSVRVIGAIPLSEDKYISLECRYFYSEKKWKTQEDCSVVKVIAWCEIPTFDKE